MSVILRPELNNQFKPIFGSGYRLNRHHPRNKNGLGVWWMLNERGPLVYEASTALRGAATGAVWSGNNLGFSGAQEVILSSADCFPNAGNPFTFSIRMRVGSTTANTYAWIRYQTTNPGVQVAIISGFVDGKVEFYAGSSGEGFTGTDPRVGSQITIPDITNFHTYTYSYSAGAWDGYLDGIKQYATINATFSIAQPSVGPPVPNTNIVFGSSGGANYFTGEIADVQVYQTKLSDKAIADLAMFPYGTPDNPRLIFPALNRFMAGTGALSSPRQSDFMSFFGF